MAIVRFSAKGGSRSGRARGLDSGGGHNVESLQLRGIRKCKSVALTKAPDLVAAGNLGPIGGREAAGGRASRTCSGFSLVLFLGPPQRDSIANRRPLTPARGIAIATDPRLGPEKPQPAKMPKCTSPVPPGPKHGTATS